MSQSAEDRVQELEKLVSSLRHDLRGAITPAALIADRLRQNSDPAIRRAGDRIAAVVDRVLARLNATNELVPPGSSGGPVVG